MRSIRIAGAATVLALGSFIFIMVRRETHGASPHPGTKQRGVQEPAQRSTR
jgi:hypothetical protein